VVATKKLRYYFEYIVPLRYYFENILEDGIANQHGVKSGVPVTPQA